MNISKTAKKLKKELDDERFEHTLGVMFTSASLAMRYAPAQDLEKAQMAGLLHDCAKCISNDKKIKMCQKYGIEISGAEEDAPSLLHAKLGAYLAKAQYGVDDPDILSAIRYHTTGRPEMTMLEKIVFLADYIEPMRWKASNLDEIRRIAFTDIDTAVFMTMRDTLEYLKKSGNRIDRTTYDAYEYYENIVKEKNNG